MLKQPSVARELHGLPSVDLRRRDPRSMATEDGTNPPDGTGNAAAGQLPGGGGGGREKPTTSSGTQRPAESLGGVAEAEPKQERPAMYAFEQRRQYQRHDGRISAQRRPPRVLPQREQQRVATPRPLLPRCWPSEPQGRWTCASRWYCRGSTSRTRRWTM